MITVRLCLPGLFILISIASLCQSTPLLQTSTYTIDNRVEPAVKKFQLVNPGHLKGSMKIKVLNGTQIFFNQSIDCFTVSKVSKDTIHITGYMTGGYGWGFELIIMPENCLIASFGLSDGKIYKYQKSDTDSLDMILIPPITQKLTLSKKPAFAEGDIISGKVEIKSGPYYYTQLEGKYSLELVAYFQTELLNKEF
jgi:hypothetical protein